MKKEKKDNVITCIIAVVIFVVYMGVLAWTMYGYSQLGNTPSRNQPYELRDPVDSMNQMYDWNRF
jgi:hypothetical protein